MKIKSLTLFLSLIMLTACQVISPTFVDYNGVRMDVAKWINQHQLLNMQQKRSLVQLSKAQQQLDHINNISEAQKFSIAKENSIAMHCAQQHLTESQISQLQQQIFGKEKQKILTIYDQQFPKIKLDVQTIQCE